MARGLGDKLVLAISSRVLFDLILIWRRLVAICFYRPMRKTCAVRWFCCGDHSVGRHAPSHERVIRAVPEWDIRLDESLFLAGLDTSTFLEAFGADVFFDDQAGRCEKAREVVATGHVPHGISHELKIHTES